MKLPRLSAAHSKSSDERMTLRSDLLISEKKIINGAKVRFKAAIAAQFPRNVVMAGKGTRDAGFWIEKPMLRQLRAIIIQLYLDCGSAGLVGADMKKAFAHGRLVE